MYNSYLPARRPMSKVIMVPVSTWKTYNILDSTVKYQACTVFKFQVIWNSNLRIPLADPQIAEKGRGQLHIRKDPYKVQLSKNPNIQ